MGRVYYFLVRFFFQISQDRFLAMLVKSVSYTCSAKICYTNHLTQCFSTAGPRPGTGPWHQLHRAARGSHGICHFSFLRIFHE